jgi:hypothetical protein
MSEPLPLSTVPARASTGDAQQLRRAERRIYLGLAIAITAAVVLGFARTFFFRPWYADYASVHGAPETIFYVQSAGSVPHSLSSWSSSGPLDR